MTTPGASLRARTPVAGALRGPARRVFACLVATLAACSFGPGAGTPPPAPPPAPPPPPTLEAVEGAVVEARLEPGERHVFPLEMEEGTYVEVHLDRPDEEIEIYLFEPGIDPSSDPGDAYASGVRAIGRVGQILWEMAEESGVHHLRVDADDLASPYRAELAVLRPATDRDRDRHEGRVLWAQAEAMVDANRLEDALEKFIEARELFDKGGYWIGVASGFREEGSLSSSLGQREQARTAYLRMAEYAHRSGDLLSEVRAWTALASLARDAGDWESAADHLDTAFTRAADERDARTVARVHDHYCRLYRDQGYWQEAVESCRESLRIRQELDLERELVSTLVSLGQLHSDQGDPEAGLTYYLQALEIFERYPDPNREAVLHNDLAILYQAAGKYLEAVASFESAFQAYEAQGATVYAALVLFNMGTSYAHLGQMNKTLELQREALRRMKEAGNLTGRIEVLHGMAWVYREMGDLDTAQRVLDDALELSREATSQPLLASSLQRRGEIQLDRGEAAEALSSLDEARRLYEIINNRWQIAAMLPKIAEAHIALGQEDRALTVLQQAATVNEEIGKRAGTAESYYQMALLHRRLGDLDLARETIVRALDIVDEIRAVAGAEELQALFSATVRPYHELQIDLLMDQHARNPGVGFDARALREFERGKARSLREIIVEADLDLDGDVPSELQEAHADLRSEIEATERERQRLLRSDEATDLQLFRARRDLDSQLIQLQEIEARIREASPRYAALTGPETVTVEEIQKSLLDSSTALLEYSLGDERSFLWLVTQTDFRTYELPDRAVIEARARCLHRLITAYGAPPSPKNLDPGLGECLGPQLGPYRQIDGQSFASRGRWRQEIEFAFERVSWSLSEDLLGGPARDQLLRPRLALVSDGALEYIPFAALPAPSSNATGSTRRILDDHEIVRLPSASVLALHRRQRTGSNGTPAGLVAIVADPVYNPDDPRVEARSEGVSRRELALVDDFRTFEELPFPRRLELSGAEARAIASLVPENRTLVLEGFDATPDQVIDGRLGGYLYVHFATHGEILTEYPKLSSLVLSQVDVAGRRVEDGNLRLQDIYGMDLDDVDMVVLSACETALGREVRGEGLMGLTRGFLYAGAERVAATLWQVQDVMTAELMEHFYRGLFEEDRAPADALRHAQLAVRDSDEGDYSFPYYWAGFVLQGEWR